MTTTVNDTIIDLRGLKCPLPALRTRKALSRLAPGALLVVPGIRPAGADVGDQMRVATPGEAMRRGASMLVVGRPITQADDPAKAAAGILKEMQG